MTLAELLLGGSVVFCVDGGPLLSEFSISESDGNTFYVAPVESPPFMEAKGDFLCATFTRSDLDSAKVNGAFAYVQDAEGNNRQIQVYEEANLEKSLG